MLAEPQSLSDFAAMIAVLSLVDPLIEDGYGWEDIVVILRKEHGLHVDPDLIRSLVLS